jgi:AraC family transcriptional regulator
MKLKLLLAHSRDVDHTGSDRVSVRMADRVVPLVPGRPQFSTRDSPWRGVVVERHTVGSIEIPQHEHASFCLHLQMRGNVGLEWWCDGRHGVEAPTAGSIILLGAGTSDRLRWDGTSERLIVSLDEGLMERVALEAGARELPSFANRWHLRNESLRLLLTEMGAEAASGWPAGGLYGELLGLSLASRLLRHHASVPLVMPEVRGGLPLHRLRRLLGYIEAHLERDLRLEQLAAEVGASPFHFARLFRSATGVTPHQYVLGQRVERAKTLLKVPHLTVAEIAAATGFSSATNLVRSFRGRVGVTPGEWRLKA